MTSRWFVRYPARGELSIRLFCFPSAGSGAAQFNTWAKHLPAGVELNAVQLPGRESRFREPLFSRVPPLVNAVVGALQDRVDAPYAFLGHSLGALLAFETTRNIRSQGWSQPLRLLLIGRRAPQLPLDSEPLHRLSDAGLLDWMRDLGGTPDKLLEIPEMVSLYLPIVRADLQLNETYEYEPAPRLAMPISLFGGVRDGQASRTQLQAWCEQTTSGCKVRMYPGGHFFMKEYQSVLIRDICHDLNLAAVG